jgi:uncharacterized repeat protein (TIGR01451 family)
LLVALLCLLFATQTVRAADDTIYGVNFNSTPAVLTINPTTGVATNAGTLSFGSAAAALDPVTGRIYYTEYNPNGTSNGRVAYWNPTTGTNTIISAGPGFQIPRLAFSANGTLYGMDANNVLYTINTSTGQFTTLGTVSGVALTSGGDLAFAPNGTLYLLAGGTLYTIDIPSLTGTSLFTTGITNPTGLTFGDNSILYASDLAFNANMYTINLTTQATTPTTSTAGTLVDDLMSLPKFADLSITKAATSSFIVGTTATYSLTVTNAGPQSASGIIRVRDTLPTGLTYSPSTNAGWTCSAAGQVVTCDRATALAAGVSSTITLTVTVAAAASPSVNNTATVDCPTFDPNTANNSSTVTTAVAIPPDLTITKTHVGNFTQGQANAPYTITVTNSGSGPTGAQITVTDTLPTGLSFVSGSGTNWNNCSASGQVVTCQRNTLLGAGANTTINLLVNVDPTAPASITNTASVAVSGELNTGNNSASNPTTINGRPDLTITKSHTGNFTQGQNNVPYTITVTNAGRAATNAAITVTDTLPAGLSFVSGTGTGWTNCTAAGQVVTCQRIAANTIAALASTTIDLRVNVAPNAPASVTNSVAVSGGGETNTGNNSATDPTTINQLADLTVAKTHTGNFTQGQSNAPYTITVTNDGDGATTGAVTVTDTLPTGLAFSSGSGTGWNNCTAVGQVVTCQRTAVNPIPANTSTTITLYVNVAANAPASVTNSVAVSGGGEIITNNNSATDPTTINGAPDLTITKSHTGNFTQGQTNAPYTLTVRNSGTGPTNGAAVTVTDTLPAGLSFASNGGTGWGTCSVSGQVVTCTSTDVVAASTNFPALIIYVNVSATASASVTNTASVAGGGELDTGNNSASDPTTINQVADLTIAKSHTGNFTQGQNNAPYTITVTNSGTGATTAQIIVTDTLPAGLSFFSGTGTNWINCTASGQVVTCLRNVALAAGASTTINLLVNVDPTAPASVTNSVSVSGGGEVTTNNNSATDPTTINQVADLTIVKTHTGNFTRGLSGTYNITVTNSGTGQTSGSYTVTDTLPAGLTPTGWSGAASGWGCIIASQTVTCTNSNALNAGASNSALTITVTVEQNAASSLTNTATVSGGGEVVTSNDTSSNPTTIVSSSDLSLTKATTSSGSGVGSQATFTITLTNSGPSDATGVAVRDQLPAGLTYLNSSASVGSYNSATGIWTVGNLASGATPPTLQIFARIDAIGSITNTAQVSASNQPDPDSTPNNNNATEDDQASSSLNTSAPSVTLCKTVQGQPCPPVAQLSMPPGSDITYVITFTNTGGSFAADFVITDPIPANTDIKVGSESHTTPLPTGLTGVTIEYFHSPTSTWITNPVSGGGGAPAGYNRDITSIRWTFNGNLSQLAPNNTGYVSFTVRIR